MFTGVGASQALCGGFGQILPAWTDCSWLHTKVFLDKDISVFTGTRLNLSRVQNISSTGVKNNCVNPLFSLLRVGHPPPGSNNVCYWAARSWCLNVSGGVSYQWWVAELFSCCAFLRRQKKTKKRKGEFGKMNVAWHFQKYRLKMFFVRLWREIDAFTATELQVESIPALIKWTYSILELGRT